MKWISVKKAKPMYFPNTKSSMTIIIYDTKSPDIFHIGEYYKDKFMYSHGSFCNLDHPPSQTTITHWAEIELPNI